MRPQDIGLLLKLVALRRQESGFPDLPDHEHYEGLEGSNAKRACYDIGDGGAACSQEGLPQPDGKQPSARFSVRALAEETGISKSQVSNALQRCLAVGLLRQDRTTGLPRVNTQALLNLIVYGVRYVYPAKTGGITRGLATGFAAPVLQGKLFSAGEFPVVWPDARGNSKGVAVEPLFRSAPYAARRDPELYAMLALVDSVRLGQARERQLAVELLSTYLR